MGAVGDQELPRTVPAAMARRSKSTVLQRTMSSLWTWQRRHSKDGEEALYTVLSKHQLAEVRGSVVFLESCLEACQVCHFWSSWIGSSGEAMRVVGQHIRVF